MRAQRSDRLALEADLRRALERGEIKVFSSPSCALKTARLLALKRCCAGIIRALAASTPPSLFRLPKKPG